MIRKLLVAANAILSAGVLVPTAIITHTYIVRPHQVERVRDWMDVLLPLIPPLVALYLCLLFWQARRRGPIMRGVAASAFTVSVGYMVIQAYALCTQYTIISQDGEAHWAMLQLPAIWIALPALILGVLVGEIVGLIRTKRPNKNAGGNAAAPRASA